MNKKYYFQEKEFDDFIYSETDILTPRFSRSNNSLIPVTSIPTQYQSFFKFDFFNQVQSVLFDSIFYTSENILLSAPTGCGKTNVALLSILKEHQNYKKNCKICYVAPMKALASEIIRKFEPVLKKLDLIVIECTGDHQISTEKILSANLIVCTPEKIDMLSRRKKNFFKNTNLIIFDEIHLLGSERGNVLESLVSKIRFDYNNNFDSSESRMPRFIALSATIPNPEDVSEFLFVDKGLFVFGSESRPVPLSMNFSAVRNIKTKKNQEKKYFMRKILLEKVKEARKSNKKILIFVHSRNQCFSISKYIQSNITINDHYKKKINVENNNLRQLISARIGVHNAGLSKKDRKTVENLFSQSELNILVSTSTLAWGVNLPASVVIILGSKYYDPEKGKQVDISVSDVLQMFGRSGRPQFDREGQGIFICEDEKSILKYLDNILSPKPLESFLIKKLSSLLNAEIKSERIFNLDSAISYLSYTFFNTRLMRNPFQYGAIFEENCYEKGFFSFKESLISENIYFLTKYKLIEENKKVDNFNGLYKSTPLGKIFADYYLEIDNVKSIEYLYKKNFDYFDVNIFLSKSKEFEQIIMQDDEEIPISRIVGKLPYLNDDEIDNEKIKIMIILSMILIEEDNCYENINEISFLFRKTKTFMMDYKYIESNVRRICYAWFLICIELKLVERSIYFYNFHRMLENKRFIQSDVNKCIINKNMKIEKNLLDCSIDEIENIFRNKTESKKIHSKIKDYPIIDVKRGLNKFGFKVIKDRKRENWDEENITIIIDNKKEKPLVIKKNINFENRIFDIEYKNLKNYKNIDVYIFKNNWIDSEKKISFTL